MYLVYFDESGNTGINLHDVQQPVFLLCALVVPKEKWLDIERELHAAIEAIHPSPRPDDFEIHATELMSGRGWCKTIPLADRIAFRDSWFRIAANHDLR
ncbi:MAG: DUF3800 domain-containing protein, partial [Pirellulaceae bacterium]|nr:DUF3800 domain-containing protein [Pirellulaceae bacterium]